MRLSQRIVNAFGAVLDRPPKNGRLVFPRKEDSIRDYTSAGLTPSRLLAILREADDGSLSSTMQLFEEMEEKDAHLFSVANTRRLALTGLEWQVVSASDGVGDPAETRSGTPGGIDAGLAEEAAAYCREVLASMESLDEALRHLSLATGRNIAIAEVVWEAAAGELRPVEIVPIDFTRIVFDEFDRPRILTEDEPRDGIELVPAKFIVHTPHSAGGHPQRGGLLRVTAMVYLAKNLALKDWMIFTELFGMPVRIARYEPNATAEEKRELLRMLESLGSNAAGIFSRAVELEVIAANRGAPAPPYESLISFLNREMSKAWLGQTLTTETAGQSSSFAATRIHEVVRQDVLADDIRKEGCTIRRDLLLPMTRFKFGSSAPVPRFRRRQGAARDVEQLARVLDLAVNRLGAKVPARWAHDALGMPMSGEGDTSLSGEAR
ncbi:MAG: DUF935 family protein [Planctomycetes bacterium]|nr:DUF935 family protein [Planctomycetota bacterium]